MQRFNVRVILGFRKNARDNPALLGDPQAPLGAERFKIDELIQDLPRKERKRRAITMEGGARFFNWRDLAGLLLAPSLLPRLTA